MADLESIARVVLRGGGPLAESARAEAQRVLAELVARGDLGREEAAEIEAAVLDAAETHRRWLEERVVGPLRGAWRSVVDAMGRGVAESEVAAPRPAADAVRARLAAIEERIARIERLLAERG